MYFLFHLTLSVDKIFVVEGVNPSTLAIEILSFTRLAKWLMDCSDIEQWLC